MKALQSDIVRKSLSAHGLVGLVLAALIYQICLTGTLSVFAGELRQIERSTAPTVEAVTPEGYARAVEEGLVILAGGEGPIIILGPTEPLPRLEIRVPGKQSVYADAQGVPTIETGTPFTDFVTELHEALHLPSPWGTAIVALAGIALLALLISGIAAHTRIFRDAFRLRLGGNERLEQADFHNRTGVWGLPFHVIVTVSGIYLALLPLLGAPLAFLAYDGDIDRAMTEQMGPQVEGTGTRQPAPDIADLIRTVERENAPAKVSFVMIENPASDRQIIHIDTDVPRQLVSGESYRFDGTGRALGPAGFADGAPEKQVQAAMFPLHFGTFGGLPVRLVYGISGVALCWLCATGMRIYLVRRRQAGRANPLLERLWAGVAWGQPAALALTFAATAIGFDPPITYLTATGFALGIFSLPIRLQALRKAAGTVIVFATIGGGFFPVL
ncbi:PepSY-associated TM helix domain-containing protein [Parasphingorhabdus cellanae]|uniref:PepSY domain-containing protein n=1 Tax=Parasphingorhabdus cellanae TaxID=2806553 RepID=A0ABX7SYX7_9SPHN|nr:PepSY-associated TM helix domain-containing protein [Parasphingorhabdus cellanae]QTD54473.1 PepSY domain-containing protein [Parasphingorhabdus cellanae]